MSNQEFNEKRTGLANAFAAAGAELLDYMGTGGALAAIPDTDRYVVAGTLPLIAKMLPIPPVSAAEQPTGDLPPLPEQHEELRARWKCEDCDGTGEVGELMDQGYFQPPERARCSNCDGAGQVPIEAYTDDQMADYARAAIAAHLASQSQAAQRCKCGNTMDVCAVTSCENAQDTGLSFAGQSQATKVQAVPMVFDDFPEFNAQAMGCGLEDRGITDRYDAMRYGFEEALDLVDERIKNFLADCIAPTAQEVTQQAAKAETAEQANVMPPFAASAMQHMPPYPAPLEEVRAMFRGEFDYVRPGNDYYNAVQLRQYGVACIMEDRRFRAQGGNTNTNSSDLAPTTSTVSAPKGVDHE